MMRRAVVIALAAALAATSAVAGEYRAKPLSKTAPQPLQGFADWRYDKRVLDRQHRNPEGQRYFIMNPRPDPLRKVEVPRDGPLYGRDAGGLDQPGAPLFQGPVGGRGVETGAPPLGFTAGRLPEDIVMHTLAVAGFRDMSEPVLDEEVYRVEATDAAGKRMRIAIDARTGHLLEREPL